MWKNAVISAVAALILVAALAVFGRPPHPAHVQKKAHAASASRPAAPDHPASAAAAGDTRPDGAQPESGSSDDDEGEVTVGFNSPADARQKGVYGAIAVTTRGASVYGGAAFDGVNRALAEKLAVQICETQLADHNKTAGEACAPQVYFYNACGALSTDPSGSWGTGWGDTWRRACAEADATCEDVGHGCKSVLYVCSPGGQHGSCDGTLTTR